MADSEEIISDRWTLVDHDGAVERSSSACTTSSDSSHSADNAVGGECETDLPVDGTGDQTHMHSDSFNRSPRPSSDKMYYVLRTRRASQDSTDSDSDYVRLETTSSEDLSDTDPILTNEAMLSSPIDPIQSSVSESFSFISPDHDSFSESNISLNDPSVTSDPTASDLPPNYSTQLSPLTPEDQTEIRESLIENHATDLNTSQNCSDELNSTQNHVSAFNTPQNLNEFDADLNVNRHLEERNSPNETVESYSASGNMNDGENESSAAEILSANELSVNELSPQEIPENGRTNSLPITREVLATNEIHSENDQVFENDSNNSMEFVHPILPLVDDFEQVQGINGQDNQLDGLADVTDQLDELDDEPDRDDSVLLNVLERFVLSSVRQDFAPGCLYKMIICLILVSALFIPSLYFIRSYYDHTSEMNRVKWNQLELNELQHARDDIYSNREHRVVFYRTQNAECQKQLRHQQNVENDRTAKLHAETQNALCQQQLTHQQNVENDRTAKLHAEILRLKQDTNTLQTELSRLQLDAVKRRYSSKELLTKIHLNHLREENLDLKNEVVRLKYSRHPENVVPVPRHPETVSDNSQSHGHECNSVVLEGLQKEAADARLWANVWRARYVSEHEQRMELQHNSTKSLQSCLDLLNSTLFGFMPIINSSHFYNYINHASGIFNYSHFENLSVYMEDKWEDVKRFTSVTKPVVLEYLDNMWSYVYVGVSDFVRSRETTANKRGGGSSDRASGGTRQENRNNDHSSTNYRNNNHENNKNSNENNHRDVNNNNQTSSNSSQKANSNNENSNTYKQQQETEFTKQEFKSQKSSDSQGSEDGNQQKDFRQKRGNARGSAHSDYFKYGRHKFNEYWNQKESLFEEVASDAKKIAQAAQKKIQNTWNNVKEFGTKASKQNIKDTLQDFKRAGKQTIKNTWKDLKDVSRGAKKTIKDTWRGVKDMGKAIWDLPFVRDYRYHDHQDGFDSGYESTGDKGDEQEDGMDYDDGEERRGNNHESDDVTRSGETYTENDDVVHATNTGDDDEKVNGDWYFKRYKEEPIDGSWYFKEKTVPSHDGSWYFHSRNKPSDDQIDGSWYFRRSHNGVYCDDDDHAEYKSYSSPDRPGHNSGSHSSSSSRSSSSSHSTSTSHSTPGSHSTGRHSTSGSHSTGNREYNSGRHSTSGSHSTSSHKSGNHGSTTSHSDNRHNQYDHTHGSRDTDHNYQGKPDENYAYEKDGCWYYSRSTSDNGEGDARHSERHFGHFCKHHNKFDDDINEEDNWESSESYSSYP